MTPNDLDVMSQVNASQGLHSRVLSNTCGGVAAVACPHGTRGARAYRVHARALGIWSGPPMLWSGPGGGLARVGDSEAVCLRAGAS